MADITVTSDSVGLVDPIKSDVRSYVTAEAIAKGQAVYILTTGKVGVADASAAGKQQFRGIALNAAGVNQTVDVCHEGEVYGFTLAGNAGSFAYLSDAAGAIADTVGTMAVRVGRVNCLNDKNSTKVLRVFTQWDADWA